MKCAKKITEKNADSQMLFCVLSFLSVSMRIFIHPSTDHIFPFLEDGRGNFIEI